MLNYYITSKIEPERTSHILWEVDEKLCELCGKICSQDSYSSEFYMLIMVANDISEVKVENFSFTELSAEVEKLLSKMQKGWGFATVFAITRILKTYRVNVWMD
jgi:hypothetical protein